MHLMIPKSLTKQRKDKEAQGLSTRITPQKRYATSHLHKQQYDV